MTLDRKQKILLPIILVAFVYVAWQAYDLFGHDLFSSSKPATTITPIANNNKPATDLAAAPKVQAVQENKSVTPPSSTSPSAITPLPANAATSTTTASPQPFKPSESAPATIHAPTAVPAATTADSQTTLSAQQREYLRLVNQYQLLKLQRLVVDEQAAIADAREKIAKSGGSDQAADLSNVSDDSVSDLGSSNPTGYKLMYIDQQQGQWSATLSKMGQYYEVNAGTVLEDGTRILSIDQQGVTLQQGNRKMYLTFFGASAVQAKKVNPLPPLPLGQVQQPNTPVPVTKPMPVQPVSMPHPNKVDTLKTTALPPIEVSKPTTTITKTTTVHTVTTQNKPTVATKPLTMPAQANHLTTQSTHTVIQPAKQAVHALPTPKSGVKLTPEQQATYSQLKTMIKNKKPEPAQLPASSSATATSQPQDNQVLINLPKNHYVIQLQSGRVRADLSNFIAQHKLENAHIIKTYRGNKPWYLLIVGDYSNVKEAQQALKTLPSGLKPWIRPVSEIQVYINKHQLKVKP